MGEGWGIRIDHQGCGKRSGHAWEVAFRWLVEGVETQVRLLRPTASMYSRTGRAQHNYRREPFTFYNK